VTEENFCQPGIMSICSCHGKMKEDKEKRRGCKFYLKISDKNLECKWLTFEEYCYSIEAQKFWQKRQ
jgi:hypothetical protein